MRVLILDGHSRAAVESMQSLGKAGIDVDVASCDNDSLIFHSKYPKAKLIQPEPAKDESFLRWLKSLDRRNDYQLIIPATEASLKPFTVLSEEDPVRKKAVLPSNNMLNIALDKNETLGIAKQLQIRVPNSFLINDINNLPEVDQYPVVLKATHSLKQGTNIFYAYPARIVFNNDQRIGLLQSWLETTAVMQQEYFHGRGFGIELLYRNGRKVWHFCHERLHEMPITGGASSYRRSVKPPEEVLDAAVSLMNRLEWHGVAMVEFKLDRTGSYCLMEINPRLWGSLALPIDAGVDFPMGLLKIARGDEIWEQPQYKINYYTRNIEIDSDWMIENIRADHSDQTMMTQPVMASVFELLRPFRLNESWDHFDWSDLPITFNILGRLMSKLLNKLTKRVDSMILSRRIKKNHHLVIDYIRDNSPSIRNIHFLCYGNICRSPFAEAYARKIFSNEFEITSSGFHKAVHRSCPDNVLTAAEYFNINLKDHKSNKIDAGITENADLILVMDNENYNNLYNAYPGAMKKTTNLGLMNHQQSVAIEDPYGKSHEETLEIFNQIVNSLHGLKNTIIPI